MSKAQEIVAKFRDIAARIRCNSQDREAIAEGFDLLADCIEEVEGAALNAMSVMHDGRPCEDCGQPLPNLGDQPAPVIAAADLPDLGADTATSPAA